MLRFKVCSAEPRCWRTMKQLGQRPALSRQRHFRVISCGRRAWAFVLPAASHFSWRRQEHRSGRVSETQPESLPGGTDCCFRPTRASTHISAPVAIVCSISCAATLLTVVLGARASSLPAHVLSAEASRLSESRGWMVHACRGWFEAPFRTCMFASLCGLY